MNAVVFLGPTLPRAEAARLLPGATLLPPARQGDVLRAVRAHRPAAIGLIDGAFLDVPAVWHREILWALQQGVPVLGAASMGALRAAELHSYGMRGVGEVFAAYRDGTLPGWDEPFEDDDEVAVVHAPAEAGGHALSDAMVDLRDTLARAEAAGMVGRDARDALAAEMKHLHFPKRSVARLRAAAGDAGKPALADWIGANHRSRKAEDARELLQVMAAGGHAPPRAFRMERALVWERFAAASRDETPEETAVLARLAQDEAAWRAMARDALGRVAALDAAPADARAALDRFRRERGLLMRADIDAWMDANGIAAPGLERLLREEAALDAAAGRAGDGLRDAMLDLLRLSGRYAELAGRYAGLAAENPR